MNVFDRLYEQVILEFSEGSIKKIIQNFSNEASEEDIRRELDDFEKYKGGLQKKDPFQYKSWIEFTEAIHAAKGKAEFKKKKIPDESQITSTDDIIADDENVTIYKGDSQDKCVMYGRGYTFCISKPAGGNAYSSYRLSNESTFYFIYFKKKPKTENDHIMVLDHTNNGYQWTFADNMTQRVRGGWDEIVGDYPELKPYENLLVNKKLNDDERNLTKKIEKLNKHQSLDFFNTFSYREKSQALKSVANLSDEIWKTLDSILRNEFLSVGPNLTKYQADDLKPNQIERYKKTRILSVIHLYNEDVFNFNKHDENTDDLMEKISTSYNASLKYFKNRYFLNYTIKDLDVFPDEEIPIVQRIATDPQESFLLLSGNNRIYYWDRVGDIIIDGISKNAKWSVEALELFNSSKIDEPTPVKLLYGVLSDIRTTIMYVLRSIANSIEIHPVIVDFFKDYDNAKILMRNLNMKYIHQIKEDNKYLYNVLTNHIANSYDESLDYAINAKWKNLPKPIYDTLKRETKIPSDATIEEKYKKISTFDRLFEEAKYYH
jgi:hypothetical protein